MLFVPLHGCRAKAVAVDSSLTVTRHADGVAALRSIEASTLEREVETTTIVMRADTLGVLRVVSQDVTRTTERTIGKKTASDTSAFTASQSVSEESHEKEEEHTTAEKTRVPLVSLLLSWAMFAGFVFVLLLYVWKSWKSRN